MKDIAIVAALLTFGVAGGYGQQNPVHMTYSGTTVGSTINLQPDTVTDDESFAGNSAFGTFTFRELHADTATPSSQPPSSCSGSMQLYFPTVTGGRVFRFQDGSLLTVTITEGAMCVDLGAGVGHLTETYQITGGTGRFKAASGTLTLTGLLSPVLFDASGIPDLLTNTGEFAGTIFRP
jgi:hypothetical protein